MEATRDIRFNDLKNTFNTQHLFSKTKGDKVIWALVVLLTLVSLLAVYSATGSLAYKNYKGNTEIYLFKQVAFILAGIMVIYFAHLVNYTFYSKAARFVFLLSIPLLFYTLFFGVKMNEGSRWIRLPIINMTMQTSDLAKLALFMYLARLLSKKQDMIKDFKKGFLPVIWPVALTCLLIAPANLSTALLLGASCLLLLFIGRVSTKHILMTIGIAMIPLIILISAAVIRHKSDGEVVKKSSGSGLTVRVDTWIGRVESFIYGTKEDIDGGAYQTSQAKIAIAKGGVFGVGPVTGVTLPLVSMGGTSFIFTCLAIGIILSVARNVEQTEGAALAKAAKQEA